MKLAVCLLIGAVASFVFGSEPQLVVLPFENANTNSSAPELATVLQDLMIVRLSRAADLKVLERDKLSCLLKEHALNLSGLTDTRSILKNGKLLGANYLILGSYQMFGDQLRVSARAVNVDTTAILTAHDVTVPLGKLIDVGDQLGAQFIDGLHLATNPTPGLVSDEAPDANLCLMRGVGLFLTSQYDSALAQFIRSHQLRPQGPDVLFWIGRCYYEQKQYAHAALSFHQFLKQTETGPQVESAQRFRQSCLEQIPPAERVFSDVLEPVTPEK